MKVPSDCIVCWFADLLVGFFIYSILKIRKVPESVCLYSVAAWFFNPFTFTIGTRGNCEPIVCAMVLWIIISLMNGVSSAPLGLCIKHHHEKVIVFHLSVQLALKLYE